MTEIISPAISPPSGRGSFSVTMPKITLPSIITKRRRTGSLNFQIPPDRSLPASIKNRPPTHQVEMDSDEDMDDDHVAAMTPIDLISPSVASTAGSTPRARLSSLGHDAPALDAGWWGIRVEGPITTDDMKLSSANRSLEDNSDLIGIRDMSPRSVVSPLESSRRASRLSIHELNPSQKPHIENSFNTDLEVEIVIPPTPISAHSTRTPSLASHHSHEDDHKLSMSRQDSSSSQSQVHNSPMRGPIQTKRLSGGSIGFTIKPKISIKATPRISVPKLNIAVDSVSRDSGSRDGGLRKSTDEQSPPIPTTFRGVRPSVPLSVKTPTTTKQIHNLSIVLPVGKRFPAVEDEDDESDETKENTPQTVVTPLVISKMNNIVPETFQTNDHFVLKEHRSLKNLNLSINKKLRILQSDTSHPRQFEKRLVEPHRKMDVTAHSCSKCDHGNLSIQVLSLEDSHSNLMGFYKTTQNDERKDGVLRDEHEHVPDDEEMTRNGTHNFNSVNSQPEAMESSRDHLTRGDLRSSSVSRDDRRKRTCGEKCGDFKEWILLNQFECIFVIVMMIVLIALSLERIFLNLFGMRSMGDLLALYQKMKLVNWISFVLIAVTGRMMIFGWCLVLFMMSPTLSSFVLTWGCWNARGFFRRRADIHVMASWCGIVIPTVLHVIAVFIPIIGGFKYSLSSHTISVMGPRRDFQSFVSTRSITINPDDIFTLSLCFVSVLAILLTTNGLCNRSYEIRIPRNSRWKRIHSFSFLFLLYCVYRSSQDYIRFFIFVSPFFMIFVIDLIIFFDCRYSYSTDDINIVRLDQEFVVLYVNLHDEVEDLYPGDIMFLSHGKFFDDPRPCLFFGKAYRHNSIGTIMRVYQRDHYERFDWNFQYVNELLANEPVLLKGPYHTVYKRLRDEDGQVPKRRMKYLIATDEGVAFLLEYLSWLRREERKSVMGRVHLIFATSSVKLFKYVCQTCEFLFHEIENLTVEARITNTDLSCRDACVGVNLDELVGVSLLRNGIESDVFFCGLPLVNELLETVCKQYGHRFFSEYMF